MNTLVITSENGETFSSISNFFIDYHMTQANGEFVKVYLYLARLLQAGRAADIQEIADHFQCTSRDICRAIRYWVDRSLLQIEYNQDNEPIGLTLLRLTAPQTHKESEINSGMDLLHRKPADPSAVSTASRTSGKQIAAAAAPEPTQPKPLVPSGSVAGNPAETVVPVKKTYSPTQIRSFGSDPQMESIIYQFEMYWGHTPTNSEYQTLLYIYEQLEFPADLLEYLIEYCASIEHTSHRYMVKGAIDWYERGIHTAQQAKDENSAYRALNNAISKELGLSRVLTPTELGYINKWKYDYAFQQDIIIEACQRASANNKISFRYINGTLSNWYENHVRTLEDIKRLDEAHEAQKKASADKKTADGNPAGSGKVANLSFNHFDQREYDNQELEDFFIDEVRKISENT